jgi:hypothetical protein
MTLVQEIRILVPPTKSIQVPCDLEEVHLLDGKPVLPRGNEATDEPMSEYDLDLAD